MSDDVNVDISKAIEDSKPMDDVVRNILIRNGFDPDREASIFQYLLFVITGIIPYDLTPEEEAYINKYGGAQNEAV